jgi:hypothetical protein
MHAYKLDIYYTLHIVMSRAEPLILIINLFNILYMLIYVNMHSYIPYSNIDIHKSSNTRI